MLITDESIAEEIISEGDSDFMHSDNEHEEGDEEEEEEEEEEGEMEFFDEPQEDYIAEVHTTNQ